MTEPPLAQPSGLPVDSTGGPTIDPTENVSGIYKIVCTTNGKVYVGSAINVRRRLEGHKSRLNTGHHPNAHLQAAWTKYGASAFVFEIVEAVAPECLLVFEQRYLDSFGAANRERGFNIRIKAESNFGLKTSDETRAKLSLVGRGKKRSAETCRRIGDGHRGKTISIEAREKMAVAKRGKPLSAEHRAKLSVSVRARGPEYHANLSASRLGNKNSLGRKHPPEVIAKIAAASSAMWARRRANG